MPPPTIHEEETPGAPSGKAFFMRYLRGGLRRKRNPDTAGAAPDSAAHPTGDAKGDAPVDTNVGLHTPTEPDEASPANSSSFAQELAAELEAARLDSTGDTLRHDTPRRNSLQRWDSLQGASVHRGNSVSSLHGNSLNRDNSLSSLHGNSLNRGNSLSSLHGNSLNRGNSLSSLHGNSLNRGNSVSSLHGNSLNRGNSVSSLHGNSLNRGNSIHSTNPFDAMPRAGSRQSSTMPYVYRGNSHSSSILSGESPRVEATSRWPTAADPDDFQSLSSEIYTSSTSQLADPDTSLNDSVDVRRAQSTSASAALGAPFHPRRRSATATTALGSMPPAPPLTRVQSLARPSSHVSPKASLSPSASLRSTASPTDNISLASDVTTLNRSSPRSSVKRSLGPFGGLAPSPWSPTPAEAAELGIIAPDDVSLVRYKIISSRDDADDRSSFHSRLLDDDPEVDSPSRLRSHSHSSSFVSLTRASSHGDFRDVHSHTDVHRDHRDSQGDVFHDASSHADELQTPGTDTTPVDTSAYPTSSYYPESMVIHYDQYTGQYVYLPYAHAHAHAPQADPSYYPYMYPGNSYTVPYYTPPQYPAGFAPPSYGASYATPYATPTQHQSSLVPPQKKRLPRTSTASLPPRAAFWDPAFTSKATVISPPGYTPLELHVALENADIPQSLPDVPVDARFFVIKSVGEEDIHKSVKYSIWTSTELGNKRLDAAFRSFEPHAHATPPVFLFFSVNGSGHFCGVAQMTSQVNENLSSTVWSSDKFKGIFQVRWLMLKDAPFSLFRHVKLTNTPELKPISSSRDTQEVPAASARDFLSAFASHEPRTCLLQDVPFYDMQESV